MFEGSKKKLSDKINSTAVNYILIASKKTKQTLSTVKILTCTQKTAAINKSRFLVWGFVLFFLRGFIIVIFLKQESSIFTQEAKNLNIHN